MPTLGPNARILEDPFVSWHVKSPGGRRPGVSQVGKSPLRHQDRPAIIWLVRLGRRGRQGALSAIRQRGLLAGVPGKTSGPTMLEVDLHRFNRKYDLLEKALLADQADRVSLLLRAVPRSRRIPRGLFLRHNSILAETRIGPGRHHRRRAPRTRPPALSRGFQSKRQAAVASRVTR